MCVCLWLCVWWWWWCVRDNECVCVCTFLCTVLASILVCLQGRIVCVQRAFPDCTIIFPSLSSSPTFSVSRFCSRECRAVWSPTSPPPLPPRHGWKGHGAARRALALGPGNPRSSPESGLIDTLPFLFLRVPNKGNKKEGKGK